MYFDIKKWLFLPRNFNCF